MVTNIGIVSNLFMYKNLTLINLHFFGYGDMTLFLE